MTEETKVAKVPPGMEIKRPEKEQAKPINLPQKEFDIDPGLPQIQYAHYTNNAKNLLACILVRPDGQAHKETNIPADPNHPLYRDIMSCLLYTSPSPRDKRQSRMPSSA